MEIKFKFVNNLNFLEKKTREKVHMTYNMFLSDILKTTIVLRRVAVNKTLSLYF